MLSEACYVYTLYVPERRPDWPLVLHSSTKSCSNDHRREARHDDCEYQLT